MCCNIEDYVLQHQKISAATSQTVVLQYRKINHKTWEWKHLKSPFSAATFEKDNFNN
jgi:hypothetical protein